jgi:hypothetical protein
MTSRRWCNRERVHGESISGLTGARAAVWRPVNGSEEMVEVLSGGRCLGVERIEGERGEVRWRTVEHSLYIGAEGEGGGW